MQSYESETDFSEPWSLSDVILVVEDVEFHVHKGVLAMCSPVFELMFTSNFKEKEAKKIPLPDKTSDEIKELLLVLYPFGKTVTESNVDFLLPLAHEYQINKLIKRCEEVLVEQVGENQKTAVDRLITAQSYSLKNLQAHCIEVAKNIDVKTLKRYDKEASVSQASYFEIFKRRSIHLEGVLSNIKKSYHQALKDIGCSANIITKSSTDLGPYSSDEEYFKCIQKCKEQKPNNFLSKSNTLLRNLQGALKSVSVN